MNSRSAFDLDCSAIIPDCGYNCPKCIQEIESTLTSMQGVHRIYIEAEGQEQKLIVEHDPTMVTVEQLIDAFKRLPSFYEGSFIPTLITSEEEQG
jgi:copper chaperone CopZ